MKEFLKAYEIGSQLGISTGRVYQLAKLGQLPCIRVGHLLKFPRNAWEEWIRDKNSDARENTLNIEQNTGAN